MAEVISTPRPEPLTPYRLMYLCEINGTQIKQHMKTMRDNGLLIEGNNEIDLTEKGRKFLALCNSISDNTDLLKLVKE